jgi:hypothetical protein
MGVLVALLNMSSVSVLALMHFPNYHEQGDDRRA